MIRERKYVMMMVHLDKYKTDIAGNDYSSEGFMRSKKFTRDIDMRNGLCGVPWGKTYSFTYENIDRGYWSILKTENINMIRVEPVDNKFKFFSGMVMHMGNIKTAGKFIFRHKNDIEHLFESKALCLKEEEIAGTRKWFRVYKKKNKKYWN